MKAVAIVAVLMLGGLQAAHAASAATPDGKVAITGDNFVVEDDKHQATFTGHVVVVQSEVTVDADQVVAFYGDDGPHSIKSFEATGNVKLITKGQVATGDKAVFDPKTRLLRLTGNVVVTGPTGRVQSKELVVDLKKNTSHFSSGSGRVTGVFNSE